MYGDDESIICHDDLLIIRIIYSSPCLRLDIPLQWFGADVFCLRCKWVQLAVVWSKSLTVARETARFNNSLKRLWDQLVTPWPQVNLPMLNRLSHFIPQGSKAGQTLKPPCRPGFSQNFYTVIVSRDVLHGQSILKGKSAPTSLRDWVSKCVSGGTYIMVRGSPSLLKKVRTRRGCGCAIQAAHLEPRRAYISAEGSSLWWGFGRENLAKWLNVTWQQVCNAV